MSSTWMNAVFAVAAVLIIGVSNLATWAITRLRHSCDHYTPRHAPASDPNATIPDALTEVTR